MLWFGYRYIHHSLQVIQTALPHLSCALVRLGLATTEPSGIDVVGHTTTMGTAGWCMVTKSATQTWSFLPVTMCMLVGRDSAHKLNYTGPVALGAS